MKHYDTDLSLIGDLSSLRNVSVPPGARHRIENLWEALEKKPSESNGISPVSYAFVRSSFVWLLVLSLGTLAGFLVSQSTPGDVFYPAKVAAFRFMAEVKLKTTSQHPESVPTPTDVPTPSVTPTSPPTTRKVAPTAASSVRIIDVPVQTPQPTPISQENSGSSITVELSVLGQTVLAPSPTPIFEIHLEPSIVDAEFQLPLVPIKIGL